MGWAFNIIRALFQIAATLAFTIGIGDTLYLSITRAGKAKSDGLVSLTALNGALFQESTKLKSSVR